MKSSDHSKTQESSVLLKTASKHVIELRYRPDARFLDKRGEVAADIISADTPFKHWNVSSNAIQFTSDQSQHIRAFFSYKNLGVASTPPNDTRYFVKAAGAFIQAAWKHIPDRDFSRVGIRSHFFMETRGFDKAQDAYRSKFLGLKDEDLAAFGGELIDVGFPLNFTDGDKFFNVITGPMEKAQATQLLLDGDLPPMDAFAQFRLPQTSKIDVMDLPDAGYYVDVDVFRMSFPPQMTATSALELLSEGIRKGTEIVTLIGNWIAPED